MYEKNQDNDYKFVAMDMQLLRPNILISGFPKYFDLNTNKVKVKGIKIREFQFRMELHNVKMFFTCSGRF